MPKAPKGSQPTGFFREETDARAGSEDDDDEVDGPSTSSTVNRSSATSRSERTPSGRVKPERKKDGCHTCRSRRKKCDLERDPETGSCATCRRLQLPCMGWGAKRPEWMKDKDTLLQRRNEFTTSLIARGKVRGVSRTRIRATRESESVSPTSPTNASAPYPRSPNSKGSKRLPPIRTDVSNGRDAGSHPHLGRTNPNYPISRSSQNSAMLSSGTSPSVIYSSRPTNDDSPFALNQPQLATSATSTDTDNSQSSTFGYSFPSVPDRFYSSQIPDNSGPPQIAASNVITNTADWVVPASPASMRNRIPPMANLVTSNELLGFPLGYPPPPLNVMHDPVFPQDPYLAFLTSNFESNSIVHPPQRALDHTLDAYASANAAQFSPVYYSPTSLSLRSPPMIPSHLLPQEDLFHYYFKHVDSMQYIFDETSKRTMETWLQAQPGGVVSLAIKMVAAVHDSQMRRAHDLLPDNAMMRMRETPETLYKQVESAIMAAVQREGGAANLTEAEATAALHMVSYHLFKGGGGKWSPALMVAVQWFKNNKELFSHNAPQVVRAMSREQRFTAKTTMWLDIFSSIMQLHKPRLLHLYEHLLHTNPDSADFFGTTNGCRDSIMFHLALLVKLELDETELARKAAPSADAARERASEREFEYASRRQRLLSIDCNPETNIPLTQDGVEIVDRFMDPDLDSCSMYSSDPTVVNDGDRGSRITNGPHSRSSPAARRTLRLPTSEIFRQSALMYLGTIMHGCNPNHPDILQAAWDMRQAAEVLGLHTDRGLDVDRSLVFAFCLAGCLVDDPDLRKFFAGRLAGASGPVGNGAQALVIVQEMWNRRDHVRSLGGSASQYPNWREVMTNKTGSTLLLV